jgi:putative ATPase
MRPENLDEFVGQEHLLGENAALRKAIKSNRIPSLIFWGPPGVGKTSLAYLIATVTQRPFDKLSAVDSGVKDVRAAIEKAQKKKFFDQPAPILFIDEIHRFNKNQQDALLGAVESGVIVLIGATTENPSFEVNSALLSRCQVYVLEHLKKEALEQLLRKALKEDEDLKDRPAKIEETEALLKYSGGDARRLYNVLELVFAQFEKEEKVAVTNEIVESIIAENMTMYDKGGEYHYDVISAFIKSVRGSDPNAAVYWLAKMIEGGEDPKFICRRLIILAAEDIGLANPNALLMANACMDSVQNIGMPESRIIMSQATIYLANSPKSNSAYEAINKAQAIVKKEGNEAVPLHIRNAPTQLMKDLDYGKDYLYPHNYENNFTKQEYLPKKHKGRKIYEPQENKAESKARDSLQKRWGKKYGY